MSAFYVVVYGLAAWFGLSLVAATIFHLAKCHVQSRTEADR